jgi:hypothetical protein
MERRAPEPLVVDLRKFSRLIRKVPGSGPIVFLIKTALDAATIVSDIKVARESLAAARAIHDDVAGTSASSREDIRGLAEKALFDMAVIHYARGVSVDGARQKIKVVNDLPEDLKQVHWQVVHLRSKYIAHSTNEKVEDVVSDNTIVQYVRLNGAVVDINSRFPEFHKRTLNFEDFARLLDAAFELVRSERNRRVDLVNAFLEKAEPADHPIRQAYSSSPFDPDAFYPDHAMADAYRAKEFKPEDHIMVDVGFDDAAPSSNG